MKENHFVVAENKKQKSHLAKLLIRDKIFGSRGSLHRTFIRFANKKPSEGTTLIGVCDIHGSFESYKAALLYERENHIVHVYVKREHRNKGLGALLLEYIKQHENIPDTLLCSWGTPYPEGEDFFRKHHVYIYDQVITEEDYQKHGFDKAVELLNQIPKAVATQKYLDSLK